MSPSRVGSVIAVLVMLLSMVAAASAQSASPYKMIIRADRVWTDSGIDVVQGTPLEIKAEGSIRAVGLRIREWLFGDPVERSVGPKGTYIWPPRRRLIGAPRAHRFPLPAMEQGPWPAFSLIGRIGDDGSPFYIGSRYDGVAERSGRLWLGINDDEPADNKGAFRVSIRLSAQLSARTSALPAISPADYTGGPYTDARVILLYVDGLRPDVLKEMASAGFLPNLKRTFIDRGVWMPNAFTVFPSNTLISNGALMTGCFPDKTGIKSQNQFERAMLRVDRPAGKWLLGGLGPRRTVRVINLLGQYAPEATYAFLVSHGVRTIADYLGKAYRYGIMPIMPINPPSRWFHYAVNTIGSLEISVRLPFRLDAVNAAYATEELLDDNDARVIAIWFPMLDKISHLSPRGQFGAARRELALVDVYLGRILEKLRHARWHRNVYLILMSDHGHIGGEKQINRRCNLPKDWAYRILGCNSKIVGREWIHAGISTERFVFFDNQGAGQGKIILPYGSYFSGPWKRNRLYELTHYQLRPGEQDVDLIESLVNFRPLEWHEGIRAPVDLVLVKLDENRVFVYRDNENQAVIQREDRSGSEDLLRYQTVSRLLQASDGTLHFEKPQPGVDPFGYLRDAGFKSDIEASEWLTRAHSPREWLVATQNTEYPDAVVGIYKFFSWRDPVKDLAEARDPDLVVTAAPGWSFRSDDGRGTDHGYPLSDSMRITLFISGPNIAHGILEQPHRIIDILPTILEMVGQSYDADAMDGKAITGIYEQAKP